MRLKILIYSRSYKDEPHKAILDSRKTQFRLPIKLKDNSLICTGYIYSSTDRKRNSSYSFGKNKEQDLEYIKPKYKVDDILYVKEPCKIMTLKGFHTDKSLILVYKYRNDITNTEYEIKLPDRFYKKDNDVPDWVSWFGKTIIPSGSIKEMARIFLKVTNVRVERLQDITLADMIYEGINHMQEYSTGKVVKPFTQIKREFIKLWNSTAKDGYKYEDNPPIFVYEFERIENKDLERLR
jgi:hypothetical protein